jgi:hypothetical protein
MKIIKLLVISLYLFCFVVLNMFYVPYTYEVKNQDYYNKNHTYIYKTVSYKTVYNNILYSGNKLESVSGSENITKTTLDVTKYSIELVILTLFFAVLYFGVSKIKC